jgi:hypothetical protein
VRLHERSVVSLAPRRLGDADCAFVPIDWERLRCPLERDPVSTAHGVSNFEQFPEPKC